jgi:arylsulfatase A-like enzyme
MSMYGYNRPTTPHLQEWAAQSAVFDFAVSTAPWTLPSHASLFTGRYPDSTMGDWRRPIEKGRRTLASVFREHGYVTGGFVDNLLYTSYESRLNAGFTHYVDYPITFSVIVRHFTPGRSAFVTQLMQARSLYDIKRAVTHVNLNKAREGADEPPNAARRSAEFLAWERERNGRPFFAFINFFEAHGLFQPTAEEERLFPGGKRIDYYDAAVHRLDGAIDRILDTLQSRGVLDNTIVVIASDHGEHLGDHNLEGHANSLYLTLLRVPLVIRFPRRVPSQNLTEPITLRDLPATILDLAGISSESGIPGSSLTRFWASTGDGVGSPIYAALNQGINVSPKFRNARGSLASVMNDSLHYIHGPGDEEELFAYRTDSLEEHNLVRGGAAEGDLVRMRTLLNAITRNTLKNAATGTDSQKP